jgi:UDP-galactopyranose mutase
MSRFARYHRVFFWEEPVRTSARAYLKISHPLHNFQVLVPHLPSILNEEESFQVQERLLSELMEREQITDYCAWYYTPMAVHFTRNLRPAVVVYDCMDELSAFRGAPPGLRAAESELFRRADLVFTGGESLYKVKRLQHSSVHCFPSSIDQRFFETARNIICNPKDQASIPHPRYSQEAASIRDSSLRSLAGS